MKKTGFVLTSFLLLSLSAFSQYGGGEGNGSSCNTTSYTCKENSKVSSVNEPRKDNTVLPIKARIDIVNLFPTPAEDKITVLLYSTENTKVNINILNVLGQQTSIAQEVSATKGSNELTIDIKAFSSGFYILEVQTTSGLHWTQKQFVIK